MDLKQYIRTIEDFPLPGVRFRDTTPLLKEPEAYREAVRAMAESAKDLHADLIVSPEARGFLFGAPMACAMGLGFVPARKPGKLPAAVNRHEYELEYGTDYVEIHKDAIKPGMKVVIADDLLATGGTALAAAKLVEYMGAQVVGIRFLIELSEFNGRQKLSGYNVGALIEY